MAQGGKLKVKTKGAAKPQLKNKGATKTIDKRRNNKGAKKGKFEFNPKKQHHQHVFKFKDHIKKTIVANIEKEVKEKAQNFEAKPFLALNQEAGAASSKQLDHMKTKN